MMLNYIEILKLIDLGKTYFKNPDKVLYDSGYEFADMKQYGDDTKFYYCETSGYYIILGNGVVIIDFENSSILNFVPTFIRIYKSGIIEVNYKDHIHFEYGKDGRFDYICSEIVQDWLDDHDIDLMNITDDELTMLDFFLNSNNANKNIYV